MLIDTSRGEEQEKQTADATLQPQQDGDAAYKHDGRARQSTHLGEARALRFRRVGEKVCGMFDQPSPGCSVTRIQVQSVEVDIRKRKTDDKPSNKIQSVHVFKTLLSRLPWRHR